MTPLIELDEEAGALLTAIAERLEVSRQHALELAIEHFIYENDTHAIATRIVDEVLVRDAVLLERLADA
jgi:predicted transcriptional regulator